MSDVVLFHSALGLRPAVLRFAGALRAAGHRVSTPDLFEGAVFDTIEEGVARRDAIGIPALMQRAAMAVEGLGRDLVYAGFSMGAGPAQALALTRPETRGLVLMHGALPLEMVGVERWPAGLAAQIHFAAEDPWMDVSVPSTLASPDVELFRYAGKSHLFADEGSPDFDSQHAELMLRRVLELLRRLSRQA